MGRGAKPPASRSYAKAELHDDSEAHSRLTLNTRQAVRTLSNATWSSGAIRRRGGRPRIVGDQDDCAALRDSAQGADEPARGGGVEILRRLVKDQAAGIAEERAGAAEDEAVCLTGRQAGAIPMR